jgi:hypothetical protein
MNSRRLIASSEAQDKASYRIKLAHRKAGCEFWHRSLGDQPMSEMGQSRHFQRGVPLTASAQ